MYPYCINEDQSISVLIDNKEHTIVPDSHQYDELKWAIDCGRTDLLRAMVEAHISQEEYQPSSGPLTRTQALRLLTDLDDSDEHFEDEEKDEKAAQYAAMTNDELRDQLDLAGFFGGEEPQQVVNDPEV